MPLSSYKTLKTRVTYAQSYIHLDAHISCKVTFFTLHQSTFHIHTATSNFSTFIN